MNAPFIRAIDEPTELHCQRKVAEMCRWIDAEQVNMFDSVCAIMVRGELNPANPIGQARFVKRWREAFRWSVLGTELRPSKRGKPWSVTSDTWWVARERSDKPWLKCERHEVKFDRLGCRPNVERRILFSVTNHALVRLAQRCGARTTEDIITAVKSLWAAYGANGGAYFVAPVAGGFAPFAQPAEGEPHIVKTVLAHDMKREPGRRP